MPHIHEKIDFTADVFVVYKNKVLLRVHDKHHIWLSVGGHIELDEDPVEAAIREVKEEVGLDVKIAGQALGPVDSAYTYLIPPKYLGRHHVSNEHEHINLIYFATSDTDKILDAQHSHEQTETKWVTMEELEKMDLTPNIRFYAQQALKELGK